MHSNTQEQEPHTAAHTTQESDSGIPAPVVKFSIKHNWTEGTDYHIIPTWRFDSNESTLHSSSAQKKTSLFTVANKKNVLSTT